MKSTYKLLGVEWDHAPLPSQLPLFVESKPVALHTVERNLFDLDGYERRIDISEVLSASPEEVRDVVCGLKYCDAVYININYEPKTTAIDVHDFYFFRVLQAVECIQKNLKTEQIYVMASDKAQYECQKIWREKNKQDK